MNVTLMAHLLVISTLYAQTMTVATAVLVTTATVVMDKSALTTTSVLQIQNFAEITQSVPITQDHTNAAASPDMKWLTVLVQTSTNVSSLNAAKTNIALMSQHHTNADAIQVTKVTVSTKSLHAQTLMNVQMETTTAVITQSVIIFPLPLNATALLVSMYTYFVKSYYHF